MSDRPRVLLDVDGPLTRGFLVTTCALLRQKGYADAWPAKSTRWDIMRGFGASDEDEAEIRKELRKAGVATSFAPRLGAHDFLDELRSWADVWAVTAPLDGSLTWAGERERWLERVLEFPLDRIASVRDKALLEGAAIVDDKPSTIERWGAAHPGKLAVLWEEPYNVEHPWQGHRAADYGQLARVLAQHLRAQP